ncbi:hypothetical protein HUG12_00810 [Halorarum salinum]|uniref:Uncharacterized protein n=1 Tax=Halorarum salinum TaxID=2743089 RepID=A0A7D5L8U0_9EURY|nr:hypothetical protein [Halobaculum salinum]QLG60369.1 hypothetical protein HUG12_00810 [Halobaculum salinum]
MIGTVVGVVVLLGSLLLLVGSIMEFVLVESLRNEEVLVRRYWGDRWRQGVRLFGFRLVVRLLVLGSLAVLAALVVVPAAVGGGPGPGAPVGGVGVLAVLLLLPTFLVLALVVGLVDGFTTVFVVPVIVLEGVGVLDGWRRLWPTIVAHP